MTAIRCSKDVLLKTLKANRETHRGIFLEAQEGYRLAAIAELEKDLKEARDGKRFRRSLTLVEPMDQTREYDRAIAMLEMSIEPEIMLEEHDFRQYVLDEWSWKSQFTHSNVGYSKTLLAQQEFNG